MCEVREKAQLKQIMSSSTQLKVRFSVFNRKVVIFSLFLQINKRGGEMEGSRGAIVFSFFIGKDNIFCAVIRNVKSQ